MDSTSLYQLYLLILLQYFKLKREKNVTRHLFFGYDIFSPGRTTLRHQRNFSGHKESWKHCRLYFDQFAERVLLQLDLNGTTSNLKKCFFFLKTIFFSKVFNLWKVLNQNKLRENAHTKICKKIKKFFGFSELC